MNLPNIYAYCLVFTYEEVKIFSSKLSRCCFQVVCINNVVLLSTVLLHSYSVFIIYTIFFSADQLLFIVILLREHCVVTPSAF